VSAKLFPKPAEYFHNNYYATVDPELCTACETCADRCQMEAISLTNGTSEVDLELASVAAYASPLAPRTRSHSRRKTRRPYPPETRKQLYKQIVKERFGVLGTLRIAGKAILGMKI
jgi:ferredoxin